MRDDFEGVDSMLTIDHLKSIFPRADSNTIATFAEQAPDVLSRYGIDATPNRLHYFLAQIGHESGGLTVVEEKLNYSAERLMQVFPGRFPTLASTAGCANNPKAFACVVYGNRLGNGPPASEDGYRYRGRGYIQITGKNNYRTIGAIIGVDLVTNPNLAGKLDHVLEVACGYWKYRAINSACDVADFVKTTKLVNGGIIGIDDRRAWLNKVRATLVKPPFKQPEAATVIAVQRALRARGFTDIGAADGIVGKRTAAAIHLLRHRNGMPEGQIDQTLLDLLEIC
ncbi:glycoside hydrolase family 19 protein [Sphingomonas sp. SAFR-052]|uniref:glycoside hydrolase family 19 protein n=1 Tax=Sphingomonas sp. SAFR-052 TaxID=3436867 RepID=UPI003F7FEA6A